MKLPDRIVVTIHSPALIGSSGARSHDVDLSTVLDAHGLPFIPKKRLWARLRDAGSLLLPTLPPELVVGLTAVLGAPGSLEASRAVRLGDAVLPSAVRTAVATAWDGPTATALTRSLAKAAAVDALTVTAATTAVDDDGAPLLRSLREVRLVREGLRLTAPLTWVSPTPEAVRLLALLTLALEQIGSGESRGLGQISATLDDDEVATRALATGATQWEPQAGRGTASLGAATQHDAVGRVRLRVTLDLAADVAISERGDPLIPGRSIRGALAASLRAHPELLRRAIVERGVACGSARPVAVVDRIEQMTGAIPGPWRVKDNPHGGLAAMVDLRRGLDLAEGETVQRIRGAVTSDGAHAVEATTRIAQGIRRDREGYFETFAIRGGQRFAAWLDVESAGLAHDVTAALGGAQWTVGAGRDSGFGGNLSVSLSLGEAVTPGRAVAKGDEVDLVLESPAMVRDAETGEWNPTALGTSLAGGGKGLEVVSQWVEVTTVSGFASRFRAGRSRIPAAGDGSVVRVRAIADGATLPDLTWRVGAGGPDGFGAWSVMTSRNAAPRRVDVARALDHTLLPVSHLDDPTIKCLTERFQRVHAVAGVAGALSAARVHAPAHDVVEGPLGGGPAAPSAAPVVADGSPPRPGSLVDFSFVMELQTDATLGGGDVGSIERIDRDGTLRDVELAKVVRNATGEPILRGSTLAGVLRHHHRRALGLAPTDPDPAPIQSIWGSATNRGAGSMSTLTILDSAAALPAHESIHARPGIAIDPATRTVNPGALFFEEVLPAGTRFTVRLHLRVPRTSTDEWWEQVRLAFSALDSTGHHAAVSLGRRSGKGRGAVRTMEWRARTHDLDTFEGAVAWATRPPASRRGALADPALATDSFDALAELWKLRAATPSKARRWELTGRLLLAERIGTGDVLTPTRLHLGDGRPDPAELAQLGEDMQTNPPTVALRRPTVTPEGIRRDYLLAGTSLHGSLKQHARRVLASLSPGGAMNAAGRDLLAGLFGDDRDTAHRLRGPRPSRVRVAEEAFRDTQAKSRWRIVVNPLTQGQATMLREESILSRLDQELKPVGGVTLRLAVAKPSDPELGLLFALTWLLTRSPAFTVGGTTGTGRGRLLLHEPKISFGTPGERREWSGVDAEVAAGYFQALLDHIAATPTSAEGGTS